MNKLPSVRMTFLIYWLSVCRLSKSLVPPLYFLPAREISSKESLTAWYNTHSRAQKITGCIRANDQIFCERERGKMFLSWKFSHRIPTLRVNGPTAWETLMHTNGSVLKTLSVHETQFLSIFTPNPRNKGTFLRRKVILNSGYIQCVDTTLHESLHGRSCELQDKADKFKWDEEH